MGSPPPPIGLSRAEVDAALEAVPLEPAHVDAPKVTLLTNTAEEVEMTTTSLKAMGAQLDAKINAANDAVKELEGDAERLNQFNKGFDNFFPVRPLCVDGCGHPCRCV